MNGINGVSNAAASTEASASAQTDADFESVIKDQLMKSQINSMKMLNADIISSVMNDEEGEAVE